ncbi:superoxide dismutase [Nocardioides KLBMP 9356]|uniref:Superoxide dismutase n=1 Tax=Nocardioides potassii TaxID=2911371 RepID=A0ABS9HGL7_9ACTN|nr:superoxide dismutase [Nocardioides potassii]MCF6379453.1 superoxide dismutase [Nocardioides potassii]
MRRLIVPVLSTVLGLGLVAAPPASAGVARDGDTFPARIDLPDGFQPEGITIGPGGNAWLGSLADGDIVKVSLRTGEVQPAFEGTGVPAVGLKRSRDGRLYVAGGDSGTLRVIDTATGATTSYDVDGGFVNDVTLTTKAAWFTDSQKPRLYRLDRDAGVPATTATPVPLTGEWEQGAGFNANGVTTAPGGKALLVVNSGAGTLYRVTTAGVATKVDLGGYELVNGDGILRHGRLLYVVRNRDNVVEVVRLDRTGLVGEVVRHITSDEFDVPTTVARFGKRLYLPNARFGVDPADAPTSAYWITKVRGGRR